MTLYYCISFVLARFPGLPDILSVHLAIRAEHFFDIFNETLPGACAVL